MRSSPRRNPAKVRKTSGLIAYLIESGLLLIKSYGSILAAGFVYEMVLSVHASALFLGTKRGVPQTGSQRTQFEEPAPQILCGDSLRRKREISENAKFTEDSYLFNIIIIGMDARAPHRAHNERFRAGRVTSRTKSFDYRFRQMQPRVRALWDNARLQVRQEFEENENENLARRGPAGYCRVYQKRT